MSTTASKITEAIASLSLRDIILHESRFERPSADRMHLPNEYGLQFRRAVSYVVGDPDLISEPSALSGLLQVKVDLGVRAVDPDLEPPPGGQEAPGDFVQFLIEASYILEYGMEHSLHDDVVKAFAEFNTVHNVWPFWRFHVFDVVQRARLPRIDIPSFAKGEASD